MRNCRKAIGCCSPAAARRSYEMLFSLREPTALVSLATGRPQPRGAIMRRLARKTALPDQQRSFLLDPDRRSVRNGRRPPGTGTGSGFPRRSTRSSSTRRQPSVPPRSATRSPNGSCTTLQPGYCMPLPSSPTRFTPMTQAWFSMARASSSRDQCPTRFAGQFATNSIRS